MLLRNVPLIPELFFAGQSKIPFLPIPPAVFFLSCSVVLRSAIVRFSGFFVFPVCILEGLCYITHHSLRMRDEVLEVKVNKI